MAQQPPRYRIDPDARSILDTGLRNKWYGICPSARIGDNPAAIRRWSRDLVLWRDRGGVMHLQDDRCPHRGAPLSIARHDGDRLTCVYHGAEILGDGTVAALPGEPGCDLVGQCAVKTYPVQEHRNVVYAWLGDDLGTPVRPLALPERLTSGDYDSFLAYAEWRTPYRYMIDNNMDPMHGAFLHRISHSMAEGASEAEFTSRTTDTGFVFEKKGQTSISTGRNGTMSTFRLSAWKFPTLRREAPVGASGSYFISRRSTKRRLRVFSGVTARYRGGSAMHGVFCTRTVLKDVTGTFWNRTGWLPNEWRRMPTGTNICMVTMSGSSVSAN